MVPVMVFRALQQQQCLVLFDIFRVLLSVLSNSHESDLKHFLLDEFPIDFFDSTENWQVVGLGEFLPRGRLGPVSLVIQMLSLGPCSIALSLCMQN